MHPKKRFLSLFLCLMLALSLLPVPALAAEDPVTVTIFTTNDIHGVVEGGDAVIGLAQAAAIKASTPNALLVDAGDATQGASFATISLGGDVIAMMNAAGYDLMAAGNHEFDYGAERLLANADAAAFPILSANVTLNGEPLLPGSATLEAAGKTIGFIGLTTTATATSTNPAKLAGVAFEDEIAAAKREIAALAERTDAIVIICHLGDNEAAVDCTSGGLLDALSDAELAEVAAVVDGHSHTLEQDAYTRDGYSIPVIQTGTQLANLGRIDLTFDGDSVSAAGSVLDREAAMAYPLTEAGTAAFGKTEKTLEEIKAGQSAILGQPLCTAGAPLWGGYIYWDYAEPRVVETSYGDFVTDAFVASARVFAGQNDIDFPVVAMENGGGISATLPYGEVTRGDVLNAFNHGNMVEVLSVTPAQLYAALEAGLVATGQDDAGLLLREKVSGSFMQVSGFTYSYDPSGESGAKVSAVQLEDGGALLRTDETTELLLATNSYVASGFPAEAKLGELGGEDQIVMDYILEQTENGTVPLSVPTNGNRIQITNDKSPETYTVTVPVLYAPEGETPAPGLTVHLRIDGGDYGEFTTDGTGALTVELTKGPHTLYLKESSDGQPVYVNNYSGSGTVTTKEGYYRLNFLVLSGFDLPVTRATAVNVLWIAEGSPVVNYLLSFSDVPADAVYTEAVRWAASEGIASGYSDDCFGAEDPVTKEQFAAMLYRCERSKGGGFTGAWMFLLDASDRETISEWAYEAMCWCAMNGVIEAPDGGPVEPQSPLTNAQMTDMLARYSALAES